MGIYIIVILLIVLLRYNVFQYPFGVIRDRVEKRSLWFICVILVLIAALRGSSVGTDTVLYVYDYNNINYYSYDEIITKYKDFPGFYLLAKSCSVFYFPIQLLFGIVEIIYLYAIVKLINRYSVDKLYSMLCYTVIGLYAFSIAGLKQTLAMAFVLLCFISVIDKKYIKAIFLAVLAYFCHHSSLVFLVGVILYFIRNVKLFYLYLIIIVSVALFGTSFVWTNALVFLNDERYTEMYMGGESRYTMSSLLFYGVLLFVMLLFGRNYMNHKKEESRIMLGLSSLAFACQAMASVSASAFRLSYYYLPFMIVALPNCFAQISDSETKRIIKITMASMIIFFFVYANRNGGSIVPYKFFWQES